MRKIVLSFYMLCICLIANAQLFRCIVDPAGNGTHTTIQSAIDACPDNERSLIFIKNGTYDEQVTLGAKTATSLKKISLIGESTNGVIITHNQSRASSGSPTYEDICTVKLYANDFYAENITIQNTAGNTGMAEALYTAGDRQTFQNCKILGYQDTYRSKKGTRGYFKNCWIEGAVDFIYAGGVEFFDDCTINCVKGGGYIVAPEDAYVTIPKSQSTIGQFIRVGFFFRNCTITRNSDVADNSYVLGRPWQDLSGTIYINCKMDKHIKSAGWLSAGTVSTDFFAEYNSMDLAGNPLDVSGRVSWSYQLPKADVDSLLTPEAIYKRVNSGTLYDPMTLCIRPQAPTNIRIESGRLVWNEVTDVAGYLIFKNGTYLISTTETSITDNTGLSSLDSYILYSINSKGVLSEGNMAITSVKDVMESNVKVIVKDETVSFSGHVQFQLYNIKGEKVMQSEKFTDNFSVIGISKGIYLLQMNDADGRVKIQKLRLD